MGVGVVAEGESCGEGFFSLELQCLISRLALWGWYWRREGRGKRTCV